MGAYVVSAIYMDFARSASEIFNFTEALFAINILKKISHLIMMFKSHMIKKKKRKNNKWNGFTASARVFLVQIQLIVL